MSRLNVNQIYTRTGTGSPAIREMPLFSVQRVATQSFASGSARIDFDTVIVDEGNYFNTSTYRYVPLIAGWYFFDMRARMTATSPTSAWTSVYKNGTRQNIGFVDRSGSGAIYVNWTNLIYMNGSTDYVEGYVNCAGTNPSLTSADDLITQLNGFLVRPD